MADSPSRWDVAERLIANLGEAQRRAEGDVLRYAVVAAVYLAVRSDAVHEISFIGLKIDPWVVQCLAVPYAGFLAARFSKAQRVTDVIAVRLRKHTQELAKQLPIEALPLDWGLSRDRSRTTGLRLGTSRAITPVLMTAGVVLGLAAAWLDWASGQRAQGELAVLWVLASTVSTAAVAAAILAGRRGWSSAFFGQPGISSAAETGDSGA